MPSFLNKFNCASVRSSPTAKRRFSISSRSSRKSSYSAHDMSRYVPSAPPLAEDIHDPNVKRNSNTNVNHVNYPSLPNSDSRYSVNFNANGSNHLNEPVSFWDIGNYKYALKRCDNGQKLANEMVEMISERADLEKNYAKSIRQWNKKWTEYLNNETSEYETTKTGWKAFLDAGNQTSEIHLDMCKALINKPVFKVQQWIKRKYEKHFFSFKQTKEFESDFVANAKPWVEQIEKLKKFKREYYESIKATKQIEEIALVGQSSPKLSQEQKEKLNEKAKRSREDQERALKRYKDQLIQIDLYKPTHMEKMTEVFNKTQNFEHDRQMFFKQTLLECYDILQTHRDERFETIFDNYISQVNQMNPTQDLEWWSRKYGPDTVPNWPVFEEYQEQ